MTIDNQAPGCDELLKAIAAAQPEPWYPRFFARDNSIDRESLDPALTELRLSELISLTEWQPVKGQGYVLTPRGQDVLSKPQILEKLKGPFQSQSVASAIQQSKTKETTEKSQIVPVYRALGPKGLTPLERGDIVRAAFTSSPKVKVTSTLLMLNIIGFIIMVLVGLYEGLPLFDLLTRGNAEVIARLGGLTPASILKERWTNLLLCGFQHFGFGHLILNLMGLIMLGRFLETAIGSARFLTLYVLSVICGSTAVLLIEVPPPPGAVVAGASGGIYGLTVGLLVWYLINIKHIPRSVFREQTSRIYWIILLNLGVSFLPNVSWQGHLGGSIGGAVSMLLLLGSWYSAQTIRAGCFALLVLIPIVSVGTIRKVSLSSDKWLPWRVLLSIDTKVKQSIEMKMGKD